MKKIAKRYLLTLTLVLSLAFSMNAFAGDFYHDAITVDQVKTLNLDGQDIDVASGVYVDYSWEEGYDGWFNECDVTYAYASSYDYCEIQYNGDVLPTTNPGYYEYNYVLYGSGNSQRNVGIGASIDAYGDLQTYCFIIPQ